MATKKVLVTNPTGGAGVNPAAEDGVLNELARVLLMLAQSPAMRCAIDPNNRLRVAIDSGLAAAVISGAVTQSGTWNLGNMPVLQQYEMMDRARMAFATGTRANLIFS